MDNLELFSSLFLAISSGVLVICLVTGIPKLHGKDWLLAFAYISFITAVAHRTISIVASFFINDADFEIRQVYEWHTVFSMVGTFGAASFAIFLFLNWSATRMHLNAVNLLFSFSGRIPRSAFLISGLILSPMGWVIGLVPYTNDAEGPARIVIWIIYGGWLIVSTWILLAIYAKRWHDCDKSGWMTLVALIPIVGAIWLFVYQGFIRGTSGSNRFGNDSLYTESSEVLRS